MSWIWGPATNPQYEELVGKFHGDECCLAGATTAHPFSSRREGMLVIELAISPSRRTSRQS